MTSAATAAALVVICGENIRPVDDADGHTRGISVELGLPSAGGAVLGDFILGTDVLTGLEWYDVTGRWTGADVDLGSSDGSANVGTFTVTLADAAGDLTPWSSTFPRDGRVYAAPGTLVRITSELDGSARPIVTGVVESWTIRRSAIAGDAEVVIDAVETTSLLARINDPALAAGVGAGDTTPARIARLLEAAHWPFGTDLPAMASPTHQATVMAQDRLSECYLTATGAGLTFRSDRYGRATLVPELLATDPVDATEGEFITADTLDLANDDELVLNAVTLARSGGTETTWTNDVSIGRHGRRTGGRSDLTLDADAYLATLAAAELARGAVTLRPASFQFEADRAPVIAHTLDLATDVNLTTDVGVQFDHFRVIGLRHQLAPRGATGLAWTLTVNLAPSSTSSVTLP